MCSWLGVFEVRTGFRLHTGKAIGIPKKVAQPRSEIRRVRPVRPGSIKGCK